MKSCKGEKCAKGFRKQRRRKVGKKAKYVQTVAKKMRRRKVGTNVEQVVKVAERCEGETCATGCKKVWRRNVWERLQNKDVKAKSGQKGCKKDAKAKYVQTVAKKM